MSPARNDTFHEMSRSFGALEQAVKTLTENWERQDAKAMRDRQELHGKVDQLRVDVQGCQSTLAGVTQDVAETKNEVSTMKGTLDDYQRSKPVAEIAIRDVDQLKKIVSGFQSQEQRAIGAWGVISRIGKAGWVLIAAAATAAFVAFKELVLPRWL